MNIVFEKMKELVPVKSCVKARTDGNFLVVSNSKANIIYLNETSKDFFSLCDGKRNISNICDELLNIYDVVREELEPDIVCLVRDMQWNDIIALRSNGI